MSQGTNKWGIPTDNIMLLANSRMSAEQRSQIEGLGVEIKENSNPVNTVLIFWPTGWMVVQRGAKRATKGDIVFEF